MISDKDFLNKLCILYDKMDATTEYIIKDDRGSRSGLLKHWVKMYIAEAVYSDNPYPISWKKYAMLEANQLWNQCNKGE